jgi:hypothetical protein
MLSAVLHTFALLAAYVVVTDWATPFCVPLVLLLSVGILVSH